MSEQNKSSPAEDERVAPTGSVYHVQDTASLGRYPPRSITTQRPRDTSPLKPSRSSTNLGHAILLAHIRTFSLVFLFMLGLLGIAFYITGRTWQSHEARARSSFDRGEVGQPTVRTPAVVTSRASDELALDLDDEQQAPEASVRTELDTDAMRQAIFMQQRAQSLHAAGRYDDAIERYQEALSIWPHLTQVWAELGRLYLELSQYSRAEVALERAVEADPGNLDLLNDLGVSLLYQNRIGRAMVIFEAVLDLNDSFAPAYFNRALAYLAQDNDPQAEQQLRAFLRLRPNDPQGLKEMAYLQAARGDYEPALTNLRRAIESAPGWVPLFVDAAAVSALMGRLDESIAYLDQIEELTSPEIAYQVYQQPAFRTIRLTEVGSEFESRLAERARELMGTVSYDEDALSPSAPMPSETDTLTTSMSE